jgi:cytoskeleton protein RodZ
MEPQHRTEMPPEDRYDGAPDASAARHGGVGTVLREKRESFRQDLDTVAGQLHIRLSYLKAIEDGRFKDLPGLTYASGFVRSYSDYLGLDGEEMVRRFREEIAGIDRQVQLSFPSLATEGKIPSGAILLISGFLAVMAYGTWYYLADRQKSFLELVPEVPAQLRALLGTQTPVNSTAGSAGTGTAAGAGETKPATATSAANVVPAANPPTPSVTPPPAPPPPPPPPATTVLVNPGDLAPLPSEIDGLLAAQAVPKPSSSVSSADAMAVAAGSSTLQSPPAPAASATPAKPAGQVVLASPGTHVKLTARMDSWVQIYDKAGKSYFSSVLRAGQTIEVPTLPGLLLTTGNIGGLDILIDGQALAALGPVGLVKRDLPLDVAGLKSASAGQ